MRPRLTTPLPYDTPPRTASSNTYLASPRAYPTSVPSALLPDSDKEAQHGDNAPQSIWCDRSGCAGALPPRHVRLRPRRGSHARVGAAWSAGV